ncbi:MAG: pantoate--beta-alanine ligase [Microbacteriaceae bacterium]
MTQIVETIAELQAALADAGTVAFVPTMGALHDGHLALVARAAQLADTVVVSIFVNPLQFGAGEDLDKYPRTLAADVEKLEGVAYVFAPTVNELYPSWPIATTVHAGPVAALFEGASRPGHFDGVLTVVAKLLGIVRPDHVVFGQKDAQQVFLVSQMVADLNLGVHVEIVETVRHPDGLARSSRNRFLGEQERRAARTLSGALQAAASGASAGVTAAIAAADAVVAREPLVQLDYLAVVDPGTFLPVDEHFRGPARVLIAARLGETRLIDNERVQLGG